METDILKQILNELKELRQGQTELRQDVTMLKQGQAETNNRLGRVEQKVDNLESDVNAVKQKVDNLESDVNAVKQKVTKLEVTIETETNTKIGLLVDGHKALNDKLDEFKDLNQKVISLQTETSLHKTAIKELAKKAVK